jgi:phosphohistidine phosphatase SixA
MTTAALKRIALSSCALAAVATAATAQDGDMTPTELIEGLQAGGHVVFIRHTSTETDYADQVDAVMGDCSTQRTLSEAGWHEAQNIGAALDFHRIPVAEVVSSEYCRAWQTADLAFGRYMKRADLNFAPAEEFSEKQLSAMREAMLPHLSAPPPAGHNTVLVGHDDPFEAATGIYPEPMGVAYVLRPQGDGEFEILGHIDPEAWF